jgi:hypothetical protein
MIAVFLFIVCYVIWRSYAKREENAVIRQRKMVGIFLVWFLLNDLYLMSQLMAPVWFEPAPVVPGLIALQYHLPFFILLSIPFIWDMINQ